MHIWWTFSSTSYLGQCVKELILDPDSDISILQMVLQNLIAVQTAVVVIVFLAWTKMVDESDIAILLAWLKVVFKSVFAFKERCVFICSVLSAVSTCVIKVKLPVIKTRDERAYIKHINVIYKML